MGYEQKLYDTLGQVSFEVGTVFVLVPSLSVSWISMQNDLRRHVLMMVKPPISWVSKWLYEVECSTPSTKRTCIGLYISEKWALIVLERWNLRGLLKHQALPNTAKTHFTQGCWKKRDSFTSHRQSRIAEIRENSSVGL